MKYNVTFTQYYEYTVEAESESEAISKAEESFQSDVCRPIAYTSYDDVEVEEAESDAEEYEEDEE